MIEHNRIVCSPLALWRYQSNFHETLSGWSFIPICQYPPEWNVEEHEQGALVKLKRDGPKIEVTDVYGRLICHS